MMKLPITSCLQLWPSESFSFHGGMFKLNKKSDAHSLLYFLSHFECDSHSTHAHSTVSTVPTDQYSEKSSLFTHAHSSLLSLTARLYRDHTNHSHYINNGWTFSGQTSDVSKRRYILHKAPRTISHAPSSTASVRVVSQHLTDQDHKDLTFWKQGRV